MDKWISHISSCSSTESLHEVLSTYCHEQSFVGFGYLSLKPSFSSQNTAFYLSNYPTEWLDMYFKKKLHFHDPVISKLNLSEQAFIWSESISTHHLPDESFQLMEAASSYKIQNGISVPINPISGTSLNFLIENTLDQSLKANIILLSHLVHQRILFLYQKEDKKRLTARESECLIWSAAGKTSDEIGIILGISEKTVNDYIGRCIAKLNASNKANAIIRALVQKEIAFSDINL